MDRAPKIIVNATAFLVVAAAIYQAAAGPALTVLTGVTPEAVAQFVTPLIADAIPREFEGKKDWGKTTRITTGLRSSGNFFSFDIHRKKSEVRDGVWKKYRLTLVEPDKNLSVRIENLKSLDDGRYALTLFVAAKMHGWARTAVYESGVHIVSLEAEGDTSIRLWIDAEIGVETVQSSMFIPGVELKPVITAAKLKFDEFKLRRVSDVRGEVAEQLGELFRDALEKELKGPKLVAKLNKSINKHPERLRLTPDKLLGESTSKEEKKTAGK